MATAEAAVDELKQARGRSYPLLLVRAKSNSGAWDMPEVTRVLGKYQARTPGKVHYRSPSVPR